MFQSLWRFSPPLRFNNSIYVGLCLSIEVCCRGFLKFHSFGHCWRFCCIIYSLVPHPHDDYTLPSETGLRLAARSASFESALKVYHLHAWGLAGTVIRFDARSAATSPLLFALCSKSPCRRAQQHVWAKFVTNSLVLFFQTIGIEFYKQDEHMFLFTPQFYFKIW